MNEKNRRILPPEWIDLQLHSENRISDNSSALFWFCCAGVAEKYEVPASTGAQIEFQIFFIHQSVYQFLASFVGYIALILSHLNAGPVGIFQDIDPVGIYSSVRLGRSAGQFEGLVGYKIGDAHHDRPCRVPFRGI